MCERSIVLPEVGRITGSFISVHMREPRNSSSDLSLSFFKTSPISFLQGSTFAIGLLSCICIVLQSPVHLKAALVYNILAYITLDCVVFSALYATLTTLEGSSSIPVRQ